MNLSVTIFDNGQIPLSDHPVELLLGGKTVATAITDQNGVANFKDAPSGTGEYSIRSGMKNC